MLGRQIYWSNDCKPFSFVGKWKGVALEIKVNQKLSRG